MVKEISIKNKETKKRQQKTSYEFVTGNVSFMSEELREEIKSLEKVGLCMRRFKGDIVTEGVNYQLLKVGDVIKIGLAEFEVTQVGKPCHSYECIAYDEQNECIMQKGVMFGTVKVAGVVKLQDQLRF